MQVRYRPPQSSCLYLCSQNKVVDQLSAKPDVQISDPRLCFRICKKHVFIAPAYSKVLYRGSTFHPSFCSFVCPSVHNLCQGAYSVAVIAGSMKPCIVITLDTHFKKAP